MLQQYTEVVAAFKVTRNFVKSPQSNLLWARMDQVSGQRHKTLVQLYWDIPTQKKKVSASEKACMLGPNLSQRDKAGRYIHTAEISW